MEHNEKTIAVVLIDEPTEAMRTEIPRDAIFELGEDIAKNGLINPITVRPKGERYEVVAGHRRFLAHRFKGMPLIRCIVRELNDADAFAIMTSENLKREDVNPVDEATHASRAVAYCKGDIDAAAKMCGESKYWVETRLQIAAMPDEMKAALREAKIKLGVALALAECPHEIDRSAMLTMAINQGVSVAMAQYWVASQKAGLWGAATQTNVPDENMPEGVRVEITLSCAVDGKKHPVTECVSVAVWRDNLHHLAALREAIEQGLLQTTPAPAANDVVTV